MRLSAIDRAFFLLETAQRPMNIGLLTVVHPRRRGSRGRPSDDLVRRMLRCPVGPPFDSMLAPGPWPALVTRKVDPAQQLHRHQLPADSDLQALFAQVCAIHPRRLDRSRPLWEMHVFDGLEGGRVGLYFKTHHGLIDGLGFLKVIAGAVSRKPGGSAPQAVWRGLPNTSSGKPAAPAVRSLPSPDPLALVRSGLATARTVVDVGRLAWHVGRRDLGLGRGLATPFLSTPDVLKAPPSSNRVLGHCAVPLARVRALAKRSGATVNDVLLATLDLALSRHLARHGVRPRRPLVVDMPVALHDEGGAGNRITILQVPLGRPRGTPAERLGDILRETRTVKDEVRTLSADALYWYSILEHAAASAIETLNLGELPMLANAVISNTTGFEERIWFNGLPVEIALPVSVVAHHQVLNVTISNYGPDLHVTFMAVREALPDVQALAGATRRALGDLERDLPRGRARRPLKKAPAARA